MLEMIKVLMIILPFFIIIGKGFISTLLELYHYYTQEKRYNSLK